MASKTPIGKKRKMNQASPPSPCHSGIVTFKLNKAASSVVNDEDPAVQTDNQTPPEIGDSLQPSEHDNEPPPADLMDVPPRAFEIGQLVKLTLLVGAQLSTVIVKVINHAFPEPHGTWQYCIQANCIIPGGSGVMWVNENNLRRVGLYDIGKGTAVQFNKGDQVLEGKIKDTKVDSRTTDIVYEVEYTSTVTIAMDDIVKASFTGLVPYVARPGQI